LLGGGCCGLLVRGPLTSDAKDDLRAPSNRALGCFKGAAFHKATRKSWRRGLSRVGRGEESFLYMDFSIHAAHGRMRDDLEDRWRACGGGVLGVAFISTSLLRLTRTSRAICAGFTAPWVAGSKPGDDGGGVWFFKYGF